MEWMTTSLVHSIGLTLLHFIWQGIVIGLLFAASMALLRPSRAATRYNLAVATLATLAVVPVVTFFWLLTRTPAGPSSGASDGGVESFALMAQQELSTTAGLLTWVVAFWLAGVILLSLRLLLGWRYLVKLRLSADRVACACMEPALARLRNEFGIVRRVQVAASKHIRSPVVIGWLRPLILFPPALVNQLPMQQIEMVLAHELAHIRRHDQLVNLFQTVMETLFFYQPAVAWVSRQIRIERENACDDLAVSATRDRLAYVEMLASLEQLRQPGSRLALAIHDGQILGRIRRLVEQARPTRQRGVTFPAILLISMLAGATGLLVIPEPEDTANGAFEALDEPALAMDPQAEEIVIEPIRELDTTERPRAVTEAPSAIEETLLPEPLVVAQGPAPDRGQAESARPDSAPIPATAEERPPVDEARGEAVQSNETTQGDEPAQTVEPVQMAEPVQIDEPVKTNSEPLQMAAAIPLLTPTRETEPLVEVEPEPITGGSLVHMVEPDFPARARRHLANGIVELEFQVDANGRVSNVQVINESPSGLDFGRSARAAAEQWRFEPFRQGGNTIERLIRVEVEFTPQEGCLETLGSRIPRC